MLVKFSNAEVAVWKLRKGVVVSYEALCHTRYGHIESIITTYTGELFISVVIGGGHIVLPPCELLWLEPN